MTITASFPGRCIRCGERYEAGERIEWEPRVGAGHPACLAGISMHLIARADLEVSDALRGSPFGLLPKTKAAEIRAAQQKRTEA